MTVHPMRVYSLITNRQLGNQADIMQGSMFGENQSYAAYLFQLQILVQKLTLNLLPQVQGHPIQLDGSRKLSARHSCWTL